MKKGMSLKQRMRNGIRDRGIEKRQNIGIKIGEWKLENRNRRIENREWRLENGEWKMENAEWKIVCPAEKGG